MIALPTVETIYEVPLILEEAGLGQSAVTRLGLDASEPDLAEWREMVDRLKTPQEKVNIALVGKYVEMKDAYYSVREALRHAALYHGRDINLMWVHSEDLERDGVDNLLRSAQGIIIPGGFGVRGIEGMIKAVGYARKHGIPYLGLCLGLQVMVIEFARGVMGFEDANSTEFDTNTGHPVIDLLPEQRAVENMGGTMRLGNWNCKLESGTRAAIAYGLEAVSERHRHRYEFNNEFRDMLESSGLVYSGLSPDGRLVEICELKDHPWMVSCQFHPEFLSRPNRPHPLFRDFIGIAKEVLLEGDQPPLPLSE